MLISSWRTPPACRVDTRVDAWPAVYHPRHGRRDESRRGTHEGVRHITATICDALHQDHESAPWIRELSRLDGSNFNILLDSSIGKRCAISIAEGIKWLTKK